MGWCVEHVCDTRQRFKIKRVQLNLVHTLNAMSVYLKYLIYRLDCGDIYLGLISTLVQFLIQNITIIFIQQSLSLIKR